MTTTTDNPVARQTLAVFLSAQRGTAVEKILAAYNKNIDAALTAKALMDATGLSRTTVNTNLGKLAQNGGVIRLDKDNVTTWSLTPTRKAALKRAAKKAAQSKPTAGKPKATRPATKATTAKKGNTKVTDNIDNTVETPTRTATGRRTKGAIDGEIRQWFQDNSNTPAGSYAVANGINSSKGAAYVALKRMANEGKATLVSTEPDRYAINFESDAWNN